MVSGREVAKWECLTCLWKRALWRAFKLRVMPNLQLVSGAYSLAVFFFFFFYQRFITFSTHKDHALPSYCKTNGTFHYCNLGVWQHSRRSCRLRIMNLALVKHFSTFVTSCLHFQRDKHWPRTKIKEGKQIDSKTLKPNSSCKYHLLESPRLSLFFSTSFSSSASHRPFASVAHQSTWRQRSHNQ